MLTDFQSKFNEKKHSTTRHHEQIPSIQMSFANDVRNTIAAFEVYGNPFMDNSEDLYALDTKKVVGSEDVNLMRNMEHHGVQSYKQFIARDRKEFYSPIQKNDTFIFGKKAPRKNRRPGSEKNLRSDVNLFARLYVSCQNRQGDLDTFFKHENHAYPPSLSKNGKLRLPADKSDIVTAVLEPMCTTVGLKDLKDIDANMIDGSMLIKSLDPVMFTQKKPKIFQEYKDQIFIPHIYSKLQNCQRCDIVFDVYSKGASLKAQTREDRGTGDSFKIDENTLIPKD